MDEVRKAYGDLAAFARETDGLTVAARSLSVPRSAREQFYGLVGAVQRACAGAVLGEERLAHAERLAGMLAPSRDGLVAATNLALYKLPDMLERLVADPRGAAAEPAFGSVLDVLQAHFSQGDGADAVEDLIQGARPGLEAHFDLLTRCAYEQWAYIEVLRALKPTRFWGVGSSDTVEVHPYETDAVEVGAQVTSPERRMPEALFRTEDGRVFGVRTEAARELDFYGIKIVRRRDHSAAGDTANLMGHRALLLYRLPSVEAVAITADREKGTIVPPDLVCEVLAPDDMRVAAHLSPFVARINALRPRRPVQVLTYDTSGAFPDGMLEDPAVAPIELNEVGTDPARLATVAARL